MICGEPPDATGDDSATVEALVAAARHGVADTTQALHRMAAGNLRRLRSVRSQEHPPGRVRNLPQARFCVSVSTSAPPSVGPAPLPITHRRGETHVNPPKRGW